MTTPYTVERIDSGFRMVGPGISTKEFPADAREKLIDTVAMLNFAYEQGLKANAAAIVEAYKR